MNIDIRESIKANFKDTSLDEIKDSISASIKEEDEITLPGLGVFFEILWKNSNNEYKDYIINTIKNNI